MKNILVALAALLLTGCSHQQSQTDYRVTSFVQSRIPYDDPYWGCRVTVENKTNRVYAETTYDCGNLELGMEAGVFGNEVIVTKGGHFWVTKAETK